MEAAWRRTIWPRTAAAAGHVVRDRSACPPGDTGAGASHRRRAAAAIKAQASYDCCSRSPAGNLGAGRIAYRYCLAAVLAVVVAVARALEISYILRTKTARNDTEPYYIDALL